MAILDDTKNLVRLFLHSVGDSEIPEAYHYWSCLSMIAGAVANRVWHEKFVDKPLAPNLYVMLIGPSGTGKGHAITSAVGLVAEHERVNAFAGRITAQALVSRMGRNEHHVGGPVYVVSEELTQAFEGGDMARSLIQHLTALYSGSPYPLRDRTIGRGEVTLRDYCINWIAGTTREWLRRVLTEEDITGGFGARIVPVVVRPDEIANADKRIARPAAPPDRDEVVAYMRDRIYELVNAVDGKFEVAPEANALHDDWYNARPRPGNPLLWPWWERADDLVWKLSMVHALAEEMVPGKLFLWMRRNHMGQAIRTVDLLLKNVRELVEYASLTPETKGAAILSDFIAKIQQVHHSQLLKYATKRGMNATLVREAIETLKQAGRVEQLRGPHGIVYLWRAKGKYEKD